MPRTVAARDGCVVESDALGSLLTGFVQTFSRRHPHPPERFAVTADRPISAVEYLSIESGISQRTIRNVINRATRTTELYIADALVAAIGCPEVFHDGTLEPQKNPLASKEARAACCSGSEA